MTVHATDHPGADLRSSRSALAWLLDPVAPAVFVTEFWQQRPLHIRGSTGKFAGLFGLGALREALDRAGEAGVSVRLSGDHQGDGGGAAAHLLVDGAEVAAHLRGGTSVCVDPIDRVNPTLAALGRQLKRELGHAGPVNVKCYYSTPGYGFNTHFDAHVVTTLQIEGRKRWRFSSEPGVPFPTDNAFLDDSGAVRYIGRPPSSLASWEVPQVDAHQHGEVVLEPGDVLCLPAGTWHGAKADGDHSLALNFSFPPADPLPLITAILRDRLRQLPNWRAGIPLAQPDPGGDMPTSVTGYLSDRVQELHAALDSLVADPELAQRWRDALDSPDGVGSTRAAPAASAAARAAADRDTEDGSLQCVLGVADAQRSARWYAAVLGSSVLRSIPEFGWVEVTTPVEGVTLGLTEVGNGTSNAGAVLDFRVDDLERVRTVLAAQGVFVEEPITEVPGVASFLNAHDLDGNRLMFFSTDNDLAGEQN